MTTICYAIGIPRPRAVGLAFTDTPRANLKDVMRRNPGRPDAVLVRLGGNQRTNGGYDVLYSWAMDGKAWIPVPGATISAAEQAMLDEPDPEEEMSLEERLKCLGAKLGNLRQHNRFGQLATDALRVLDDLRDAHLRRPAAAGDDPPVHHLPLLPRGAASSTA